MHHLKLCQLIKTPDLYNPNHLDLQVLQVLLLYMSDSVAHFTKSLMDWGSTAIMYELHSLRHSLFRTIRGFLVFGTIWYSAESLLPNRIVSEYL